jgi:hypothetical protein
MDSFAHKVGWGLAGTRYVSRTGLPQRSAGESTFVRGDECFDVHVFFIVVDKLKHLRQE